MNLFGLYSSLVDTWAIYDNSILENPQIVATSDGGVEPVIRDMEAWLRIKEAGK